MSSHTERWEAVASVYDPLKAGSIDGTDTIPHDHAIVRAMEADYKPNKSVIGDPKATIFIGNLDPDTTEDTIEKKFSRCGDIKRIRLVRDIITGHSKRYCFVEYVDKYSACEALRKYPDVLIDDREVIVLPECERTLPGWIPRRLGGGLSGKKESGQLRFGGEIRPFRKPLNVNKSEEQIDERTRDNNYRDRSNRRDRSDSYQGRSSYREANRNEDGRRKRHRDEESGRSQDEGRKRHRDEESSRSQDQDRSYRDEDRRSHKVEETRSHRDRDSRSKHSRHSEKTEHKSKKHKDKKHRK